MKKKKSKNRKIKLDEITVANKTSKRNFKAGKVLSLELVDKERDKRKPLIEFTSF